MKYFISFCFFSGGMSSGRFPRDFPQPFTMVQCPPPPIAYGHSWREGAVESTEIMTKPWPGHGGLGCVHMHSWIPTTWKVCIRLLKGMQFAFIPSYWILGSFLHTLLALRKLPRIPGFFLHTLMDIHESPQDFRILPTQTFLCNDNNE